ncbi:Vacuolar protein sorting-associated protein 54, chloroplastic [Dichanthelium oligosanthes]|uniref:Vacuolar protein sorting-associated protein 54, chloroplastic n=1 Tax=Dichanthelium oligosanthes TaxID=888268 RepID=A0A1E5V2K1_9POAL|nr:Vacuolar protein sorting-associated protein 54, chloroplastic [Dichanthelium oligosanthes]
MASRPPLGTTSVASVSSSTDSPTSTGPPGGVPQSITALLNNPLPSAAASSYSWLPWPPTTITLPDAAPTPPSHPCEVNCADFAPYLAAVSDPYARFADIRLHATAELAASSDAEGAPAASSGLAACLREVPALFFKEDFALEDGPTFQAACPLDDDGLQERLGQHLDVVEAHLVREIALRSESFYEAQGRLRGLDGEIVTAVGRIRELREVVRVLTGDLVGAARQVQELNATRGNLVALQQKLTVILYVSQALAALKLLVAAADCAGALDVIDDLQNLLDKLPAVLRIYRDTLITVMKASIKATVAELLPVLTARPIDSDSVSGDRAADADAGGQSLANKLRSLSSEGFVQLLSAIFRIVQVHLQQAAEVKRIVEWVMGNLDGTLSVDASNPTVQHGGSVVSDISQENDYSRVSNTLTRTTSKIPFVQGKANDLSIINSIKNVRADVLRENTEAVFAACDAAHGRWAKLLGVRAALHPRLRLQEFLIIYNITEEFIAATEKVGGRLGYNIRGILQQQSKQFVDYQHNVRMTKIKAVLDQETWVAVDVPEEFQAIVLSLSSTYSSANGMDMPSEDDNSKFSDPMSQEPTYSAENNADNGKLTSAIGESKVESTSPQTENNVTGNQRPTLQTIAHGGVRYHMVNCGLILLKMLSEYVDISKCLPSLSFEVVQRVVEILKLFNNRTCQLVLGAGAMQVSGLKSITSKHLALASQIISFTHSLIPDIRRVLFLKIPEARKQLLMSELDRVTQDYKVHRDEIHTKLVQIMRERLLANLRKLPQIVEGWNGPEDNDLQPSQFAKAVTKEVTYLHRILSQTLLEVDVQTIFRQVVQIFHSHITEAFGKLEINTPQAKNRLCRDVQHILTCIRKLPAENFSAETIPNYGILDEFLAENFGTKVGE